MNKLLCGHYCLKIEIKIYPCKLSRDNVTLLFVCKNFQPANMINYVCKCDNALCAGKNTNTGCIYLQIGQKRNKSIENVIERKKTMNKLTINLEDPKTQH